MTNTVRIEALFRTEDAPTDVLAYALSLQHERHAILKHSARRVAPGVVSVVFHYAPGLPAEVGDVADRLLRGPLPADVTVR